MFKKGTYLISASFSRKILITMCGSCGFGKDLAFVRQKVWIEDPDITLQVVRSERTGKMKLELIKDNEEPKLIFDSDVSGRVSNNNIGEIIKKIRETEE